MASPLRVSILDQSPVPEGATGGEALRNTLELARLADQLGYHRYWVAEHHGTPGLACTSPEILVGQIACTTTRIRTGSGGVMLPHYSPLKVAENFSMLSGLFRGRIDLGVGRAAGTDAATSLALQRDRRHPAADDFPEQLDELLAYFDPRQRPRHSIACNAILPGAPEAPQMWLLGSSWQSAIWAAELGLPYAFADFINPAGAPIAAHYREAFTPCRRLPAPRLTVAAWAICAPTADEAEDLAASLRMMVLLLQRGELIQVPPVEKVKTFLAREEQRLGRLPLNRRILVGTPASVRGDIEALAQEYGAEEVLLVNILHDHGARLRSYGLIAEVFGLEPEAEPGKE